MIAKKRLFSCFCWMLYACAVVQFIRFYVVGTYFYLNMPRYLAGGERLPFQERVLPIFLMWPINHSSFLMHHLAHDRQGVFTPSAAAPDTLAFYMLSLVSFSIASFLVFRLYKAIGSSGVLSPLVLPIFMVLTLWTYVVHIDANYSFPYDMPSVAFFTGGLLAIYQRRYLPLLGIMFFGTMNRETTLFLVGIYVLDAATRRISEFAVAHRHGRLTLRERFSFAQVPWLRTAVLFGTWLAVKVVLYRHFAHNDNSENFVRLRSNLGRFGPRLWPTLLNVCGYVLPLVLIQRHRIRPLRFANYLYIFPVWFAVMMYTGVILETRIYGELCGLTAVASVLLLEERVVARQQSRPAIEEPMERLGAA